MQSQRSIQLLGGFSCPLQEGQRLPTRRALLLLARLALRPGKALSRDTLGELLWPEGDPERQRANLRVELLFLRRALGEESIEAEGKQFVRLGSAWSCDVAAFEAAALAASRANSPRQRREALLHATSLYTGELLPGYDEDWVLLEQARLRTLFHDLLYRLIRELESVGGTQDAQSQRRLFAQHFPEHPAPPLPCDPGAFVGRERELTEVRCWLCTSQERVLTIIGPPGIGKSRLAREALLPQSVPQLALADLASLPEGNSLILLDGLSPAAAPYLAERLQCHPTLRLVLTARWPLGLPQERVLSLSPLTPTQSLQLLQRQQPTTTIADALALLAGNPRALELALAALQTA